LIIVNFDFKLTVVIAKENAFYCLANFSVIWLQALTETISLGQLLTVFKPSFVDRLKC